MAATILVADDDRAIRVVLSQALGQLGHNVRAASDASTLWQWVREGEGDVVITDVVMPDENALDLIPRIRERRPNLPIIVMSAQNTLVTAIRATERGAFEYLAKPFDLTNLVGAVERALAEVKEPGHAAPAPPEDHPASSPDALPLIGRSPAMQEIYRVIARLVNTDMTVLIHGESGTGKELVARALHDFGRRRDKPFVAVNMAAIPRELIESELFGHEKGAFTGAVNRGIGRFEQAAGGTLFLDEIGDMPIEAQTRLLRVLQSGEFSPVGGRQGIRADVRIIAATHRDLRLMIQQGGFREDLFYRLNVVPIRLPPLRQRPEDIADLARHFLALAQRDGLMPKTLDPSAIERMKTYSWPGNVRELENLMRRMAVLYSESVIDRRIVNTALAEQEPSPAVRPNGGGDETLSQSVERHLDGYFKAHPHGLPASGLYDRILREVERPLLALSLQATRGNQIRAAELLGLNRNTLRKKLRELDLQPSRSTK
ncbi:nitrogen regulation protein NR(I) [Dongia sedimenti]|uniref:DNA-binding transcriptional regulator NtrC n=1 Tax=Dongia sedimenti TaxID=3064282 RepID=A0ABU0YMM5_9PROT|nr:nitrogen regulation protein NR(I) [Rhodospirillaceae bacterium R-7]